MPVLELSPQCTLHYERIDGDADRPCLVFLHEGLGCTALWKNFPAQLCAATGCPGLIYDRQGYGLSSPLGAKRSVHYLHRAALDELPALLARLLPDRDYLLIGHSDGGSIALLHGAERSPRLRGIITEAAHVSVEPESLAGIRLADQAYATGKLGALQKYHGDKTEAIFRAWADTWLAPWYKTWNIEYALASIRCPVLAMQGEGDEYGTPDQVDRIVRQCLDARAAMIADCGHTPHHEQRDAVLGAMRDFIAEIASGR